VKAKTGGVARNDPGRIFSDFSSVSGTVRSAWLCARASDPFLNLGVPGSGSSFTLLSKATMKYPSGAVASLFGRLAISQFSATEKQFASCAPDSVCRASRAAAQLAVSLRAR